MLFKQRLVSRPSKPRSYQGQPVDALMAGVLQGLARLNVNRENSERMVLGDKKNVQHDGGNNGRLLLKKSDMADIIVISDGRGWAGDEGPVAHRYNKAAQI